jgi:peptidyl-prolyl cis-trans isomerase D
MLQVIRERFTGVFAIILLGTIAVSFIFFGIGNFTFLSGGNAATVEGVDISVFQLESAYQERLLQFSDYGNLPTETRQLIKESTLEQMIRDAVISLHVADKGYRIGDDQITQLIQNATEFQEDGVFNRDLYYAWLDQTVQTARAFEAAQRRALRLNQVQRGIGATAFVTPTEYRRYLNLYFETRVASIATFDIAALADTVVIRDEDVQAYYDARPDAFRSPETVDFEYLEINRDVLSQNLEISEDVLQQYYEDNSGRFRQDEQRQASHILITPDGDEVAAEEQARTLTVRIQAGEPFEDLARQYSKDGGTSSQGGSLGVVMQSQMPGALGDAIFSMEQGEILGPVTSDFGFHVIKLDEVIEGGPLPLDQVRGELLQELRSQGIEGQIQQLERDLSDALFDATDLVAVSGTTGLEIKTVGGYTRNGGAPFGGNQSVIEAVFDPLVMVERQISDLIEVDATRSIMIRVTEHHEEARRPLAEVNDDIVFSLQSERALNMVDDRSRRLRDSLSEGRSFSDLAEQLEATFVPNQTLNRLDENMDKAVLDAIFRAKKPSPGLSRLGSVTTTEGNYAVFTVNAVFPGRPESIALADRDQRKEDLQNAAGAADYVAFISELTRNADIERNEDALVEQDFIQ